MADTVRTRAEALALLPNNTTGEISPQDVRDVVVSLFGNYGEIGVTGGVQNQVTNSTPGVFDKVTLYAANGIEQGSVSPDPDNDQVTLTVAGTYLVIWDVSFTGDNSTNYTGRIEKNGAALTFGKWVRSLDSNNSLGHSTCFAFVEAEADDVITTAISSNKASSDFIVSEMTLTVFKVG